MIGSIELDDSLHATLRSKSGEPLVLQHVAITGDLRGAQLLGVEVKLNRTRIWNRIEIDGKRERAIINKSSTSVGVRVRFFNDLDQIYSFVDYSLRRVAEGVLMSLGFVKMPKQLSDLSPWARIELTWKAREDV